MEPLKCVAFGYILGGKTPSGRNCTPTAELTIRSRRITMAVTIIPHHYSALYHLEYLVVSYSPDYTVRPDNG